MPEVKPLKTKDEPIYTSKETESIVKEIKEVSLGLKEIADEVEIKSVDEVSVDSQNKQDLPAAELKPKTNPIENAPAKLESPGTEPPKPEQAKEQAGTVESNEAQSQPINNPIQPMVDQKTAFNPFSFLKKNNPDKNAVSGKKKMPKAVKILLIGLAFLILLAVISGAVLYSMSKPLIDNGKISLNLSKEAYQLLKAQDLVNAAPKLAETKNSLLATQKAYQKFFFLKAVPFVSKYQEDGEAGINAAIAGVEAGEIFIQAVLPYADVLGFTGEESTQSGTVEDRIVRIIETLDKVSPQLDEIGQKLTVVDSEMKKIDPADYPEQFRGIELRAQMTKAEALIAEAKKALTDAQPLVKVLPSILGYPDTKKYLVLFQNDGELRPTGGFMSAFAVLSVEKGKIKSEKSEDIYALDNKFSTVIKPPEAFTTYIGEKRWFMRNMNWSPDYKLSMDTFKENYDTLRDEYEINGIIAIDTNVLSRIIEVIGPLKVDEWGTYTTENDPRCNLPQVICELEHIIDRPLATIATNRKASILGPMMKALMERSMGGGKEQLSKLLPLAFQLMEEKHVLVYFLDENQQQAAESFNIAGRVLDYDGDYLHINNANLGGAKSNFYVSETVEQEVNVADDGNITKKVTLTYKHNEPGDNCNLEAGELCLSGKLRSYFRIYVPKGSVLTSGRGSMVEIKTGEDMGKTYFEGFYELRPELQIKLELEYTVPYKPNGEYAIFIQKQPGVKNSQHTLNLNGKTESFTLNKDTEKRIKL